MIYRCENCGKYALEEDIEFLETTYESYYGVSSEFPNRTRMDVSVCPCCNAKDTMQEMSEVEIIDDLNGKKRLAV